MHVLRTDRPAPGELRRGGGILILAAALLVALSAFTAFVVDVGYITLTRAELSKTADGAALAAVSELPDSFGAGAETSLSVAFEQGRAAAITVAAANVAGGKKSTYLNGRRDVRFGEYRWDAAAGQWIAVWGATPSNLVEITVRRDVVNANGTPSLQGDGPLELFFAPLIGTKYAGTRSRALAAMLPAVGYRIVPGSRLKAAILPLALDLESWDSLIGQGAGSDDYTWNPGRGAISRGGDGVPEINLYPIANFELPAGQRGVVEFGQDLEACDIDRQIREGVTRGELGMVAGEAGDLRWDRKPILLQGDPGLNAGMEEALNAILGEPRAIPIFASTSVQGRRASYTIVKFVPIRLLSVRLTGKPAQRRVIAQPAVLVDPTFLTGEVALQSDTMFGPATLVR